jgi:hypothetical protein
LLIGWEQAGGNEKRATVLAGDGLTLKIGALALSLVNKDLYLVSQEALQWSISLREESVFPGFY